MGYKAIDSKIDEYVNMLEEPFPVYHIPINKIVHVVNECLKRKEIAEIVFPEYFVIDENILL